MFNRIYKEISLHHWKEQDFDEELYLYKYRLLLPPFIDETIEGTNRMSKIIDINGNVHFVDFSYGICEKRKMYEFFLRYRRIKSVNFLYRSYNYESQMKGAGFRVVRRAWNETYFEITAKFQDIITAKVSEYDKEKKDKFRDLYFALMLNVVGKKVLKDFPIFERTLTENEVLQLSTIILTKQTQL